MPLKQYYALPLPEIVSELNTDLKKGLSTQEAQVRLLHYGKNKLEQLSSISPLRIFFAQFSDFLVLLLIGASIISFFIGEKKESLVILFIVIVNGAIGFFQEYRAERSIEALRKLESPHSIVIRDGKEQEIPSEELVPGDIIKLSEGCKIPADARLTLEADFQVNESLLTGESLPVTKGLETLKENTLISERTNMVFSATIVSSGRGKAVVTATGMDTEVGAIARMVQSETKGVTPLQEKIEHLGKILGLVAIGIAIPGFILGYFQGREPFSLFLLFVSLVVSAVPEGLPIIITITLALGVQRLLKAKTLVRRLPIVEVLGGTDVICTDKTGTLTCNAMTVENIVTADYFFDIEGNGFTPQGDVFGSAFSLFEKTQVQEVEKQEENRITPLKAQQLSSLQKVLDGITLCNDATIDLGDPTERALIVASAKLDIEKVELKKQFPRIDEVPFSSDRKYMLTLHQEKDANKTVAFLKGAVEIVLEKCSSVIVGNKTVELTKQHREAIQQMNELLASQGMRVLALGYKKGTEKEFPQQQPPSEFIFAGLIGMIDPPRAEVQPAIATCRHAGIRVVMITGDHRLTAEAIGKKVGLESSNILTGDTLEAMSDAELEIAVEKTSIFARVSSEHKLRILSAFQKNKHVVAMIGDGVNDAPALKKANIGISVGSGTDLSKETSDMVLLDDNFATFEKAIKEGRVIFDNVQKFVHALLAVNLGEILLVLSSILLSVISRKAIPVILLPIHLLWINLLTDSIPAMALGLDGAVDGIMARKPRSQNTTIFSGILFKIIVTGFTFALVTFVVFSLFYPWWLPNLSDKQLLYAQTIAFCLIVFFELFYNFTTRSPRGALHAGLFTNKWLLGAVALCGSLQVLVISVPALRGLFRVTSLDLIDWGIILGSALGGVILLELVFFVVRKVQGTQY
ncbi:MAG: cation-translocating P-type ATPase [bacterium]